MEYDGDLMTHVWNFKAHNVDFYEYEKKTSWNIMITLWNILGTSWNMPGVSQYMRGIYTNPALETLDSANLFVIFGLLDSVFIHI